MISTVSSKSYSTASEQRKLFEKNKSRKW